MPQTKMPPLRRMTSVAVAAAPVELAADVPGSPKAAVQREALVPPLGGSLPAPPRPFWWPLVSPCRRGPPRYPRKLDRIPSAFGALAPRAQLRLGEQQCRLRSGERSCPRGHQEAFLPLLCGRCGERLRLITYRLERRAQRPCCLTVTRCW